MHRITFCCRLSALFFLTMLRLALQLLAIHRCFNRMRAFAHFVQRRTLIRFSPHRVNCIQKLLHEAVIKDTLETPALIFSAASQHSVENSF